MSGNLSKLSHSKIPLVEFAILKLDPKTGEPKGHILKAPEIDKLLVKFGLSKKKDEERMDFS